MSHDFSVWQLLTPVITVALRYTFVPELSLSEETDRQDATVSKLASICTKDDCGHECSHMAVALL